MSVLAARLSFATTFATVVVLLGAALGRQAELLAYAPAHTLIVIGTGIGLLALLAGFAWWIARLVTGDTRFARWGYIGLIGALAIMLVPLNTLRLAFTMPELNDITTDPESPPVLHASSAPPPYDGQRQLTYQGEAMTAVEAQKRAYPEVRPVKVIQPEMALYWRAFETAKKAGWTIDAFDKNTRTLQAHRGNFWTGDTSDVAVRVRKSGMGARLDIRSRSRMSQTDAGANAALIRDYFKALSER
jgi:hypothetical protein